MLISDIYNAFPEELKENIINTYVVSGYEDAIKENYKTTDKIYLLSTKEVWENETSNKISHDTARELTRQLDYYKNLGVTTSKYLGAIKNYNGSATYWWLRSAYEAYGSTFYDVYDSGDWNNSNANYGCGVSVAFRIG